ncbi:hypothetical protein ABIB08_007976 [Bradyrhizobium sp. RT11b]
MPKSWLRTNWIECQGAFSETRARSGIPSRIRRPLRKNGSILMPSLNPTNATTLGNGFVLLSRRQVLDAAITSLNTIGLAVVGDKEPFVRTVLYRPVADTRSMGLVVLKSAPMFGKKILEGQQCVAIPDQAFHSPAVLRAKLLGEDVGRESGTLSRTFTSCALTIMVACAGKDRPGLRPPAPCRLACALLAGQVSACRPRALRRRSYRFAQ